MNIEQSFLMGQFDRKGLKTPIPFAIYSKDGNFYSGLYIIKGSEEIREEKGILKEAVFMVNGNTNAYCHWTLLGENSSLETIPGCIEVDFTEIGNYI